MAHMINETQEGQLAVGQAARAGPIAPAPLPPAAASPPALAINDLPDALLEYIFEQLDTHTVLQRAALVSRRFRRVAESEMLWKRRLPPALVQTLRNPRFSLEPAAGGASSSSSSSSTAPAAPPLHRLYCSLASSNLLRNPWFSLDEQMEERRSRGRDVPGRARPPWLVPGGSAWQWGPGAEEGLVVPPGEARMPPAPLPPYTTQAGPSWRPTGAVASSYGWTGLLQEVDLVAELQLRGLSSGAACTFLDACPALELEVFVAGRFDCAGWMEVCLALDGRPGPVPLGRNELLPWLAGAATAVSLPRQDVEANVWRRQQLRAQPSAAGVRRAVLLLVGSEHSFWAGNYGCKFAAPVLRFEV